MSKLDDIAKVAGVSRHTVARILSGKRQEKWPSKQEQGDRIRRIAEEMGYRPNASARALVLGKFNCVGLMLSTRECHSYLSQLMITSIDEGLSQRNIHLTVARLSDEHLTDAEYVPKILREWLCDGLLMNYDSGIPPKLTKLMADFKIPAIWLNCKLEHDAVHPDDIGAGRSIVGRLMDHGHRKIVYADSTFFVAKRGAHQHYNKTDRKQGCVDGMAAAGLQCGVVHDDEKKSGLFLDNVHQLLTSSDRPTAIAAYSRTEVRAIREIAASLGLSVPGDLSIMAFRGEGDITPLLWDDTAMVGPERQMCLEAVDMLMMKIARPQVEIATKVVPFFLYEGSTVARPKEA